MKTDRTATYNMWMEIEAAVKNICCRSNPVEAEDLLSEVQLLFFQYNVAANRDHDWCISYCKLLKRKAMRNLKITPKQYLDKNSNLHIAAKRAAGGNEEALKEVEEEFHSRAELVSFDALRETINFDPAAPFVDPINPLNLGETTLEFLQSPAVSNEVKAMVKLILQGETLSAVAKLYDISLNTVKRRIIKEAAKLRPAAIKQPRTNNKETQAVIKTGAVETAIETIKPVVADIQPIAVAEAFVEPVAEAVTDILELVAAEASEITIAPDTPSETSISVNIIQVDFRKRSATPGTRRRAAAGGARRIPNAGTGPSRSEMRGAGPPTLRSVTRMNSPGSCRAAPERVGPTGRYGPTLQTGTG